MHFNFWTIAYPILFGLINIYFAQRKGRNPIAWFFIGVFLDIIGTLILMLLPAQQEKRSFILKNENKLSATSSDSKTGPQALSPWAEPISDLSAGINKTWYYLDEKHQRYGPISLEHLKGLWSTKSIEEKTLVWSSGLIRWYTVHDLPHLLLFLNS